MPDVAFVHQEYAFGGNYDLTHVTDSLDVREVRTTSLRTERPGRFSSDRVYVSTIVRF